MKRLLSLPVAVALLTYPLLVYFGLHHLPLTALAMALGLVLVVRALLLPAGQRRQGLPVLIAGLLLMLLCGWRQEPQWLLWYPVAVNLALLFTFAASLRWPPTTIERLARLREPQLPDEARPYLRRLTVIWCLFFIANGAIATATVISDDMALWALYNGLIAYLLIGALVAGEWLYRRVVLQRRSAR